MQIQKIQPSIPAAQAADGKNKESKNKFNVSFTFVSYKHWRSQHGARGAIAPPDFVKKFPKLNY